MDKIVYSIIFVIALSIFVVIQIHPAFAMGQFIQMPIRVQHGPTICAVEPITSQKFPTAGKQLLDETEYAVIDWSTKLNQGLGRHPVWNINLVKIPLGQQKGFDYSKCDITIHYFPEPEKNSNGFIAAGITIPNFETSKTNIEIYYSDLQSNWEKVEWTENNQRYYTYINRPYYTGLIATSTQLGSTIRHEMGHAFGLAHYIVPRAELQNIINGLEDMPSIMIDTVTVLGVKHYDITPLDIAQIKSIYGDGGFDSQVSSKFGYQRVHQLSMDKQTYLPNEKITLKINTDAFSEKSFAEILVIDSENHLKENAGISRSNSTIPLVSNYQKNETYWAELLNPITGDYDFIRFTVEDKQTKATEFTQSHTTEPEIEIPVWVKNNARYWAKGSMSDTDFISGIRYLISQGIIENPQNQSGASQSNQIPKWIKNNAGWWAEGTISDDDFVHAVQYLTSNGIIKVK